jgi:hypothetical protein
VTYSDPYWDLPVTINGQTSDLIENVSGANAGVNTLHLPGTLQNATETYRLNWVSRTILNPSLQVALYPGTVAPYVGATQFTVQNHGLRSGQKVFFTQPITATVGATTSNLVSATTKLVSRPYWVKVVDQNTFVISNSLANYTVSAFVPFPATATVSTFPSIFYTQALGGGLTTVSPIELLTIPMIRARKYAFDSSNIFNVALDSSVAPGGVGGVNPSVSIFLNNTSVILGEDQITPYGEDITGPSLCDWLPALNLVAPTLTPVAQVGNAYCVPTVDQFFQPEAYFVPAIDPILAGSYDAAATGTTGPVLTVNNLASVGPYTNATYFNVVLGGGSGTGAQATVVIAAGVLAVVSDDGSTGTVGTTGTTGTTGTR